MDFTMDFGPYFTASVLLRFLGFPLLTAAAGFLVYWRMIRDAVLGRRIRRISVAVLSLALAVAVMIFCILPMWLEAWGLHSPPFLLALPLLLLLIWAGAGAVLCREKRRSLGMLCLALLLFLILPLAALWILNGLEIHFRGGTLFR